MRVCSSTIRDVSMCCNQRPARCLTEHSARAVRLGAPPSSRQTDTAPCTSTWYGSTGTSRSRGTKAPAPATITEHSGVCALLISTDARSVSSAANRAACWTTSSRIEAASISSGTRPTGRRCAPDVTTERRPVRHALAEPVSMCGADGPPSRQCALPRKPPQSSNQCASAGIAPASSKCASATSTCSGIEQFSVSQQPRCSGIEPVSVRGVRKTSVWRPRRPSARRFPAGTKFSGGSPTPRLPRVAAMRAGSTSEHHSIPDAYLLDACGCAPARFPVSRGFRRRQRKCALARFLQLRTGSSTEEVRVHD